ncbi:MAG TPA: hypothetical protein DD660_03810, partial [Mitsuokella multacida]|nr:hypothetical protein [Mitsuokella multacida]
FILQRTCQRKCLLRLITVVGIFVWLARLHFYMANILRCYQISACSILIEVKSAQDANQTIKYIIMNKIS